MAEIVDIDHELGVITLDDDLDAGNFAVGMTIQVEGVSPLWRRLLAWPLRTIARGCLWLAWRIAP